MTNEQITIAVLGTGRISHSHLRAISKIQSDNRIGAPIKSMVVGRNLEKVAALAKEFGAEPFQGDWKQAVREESVTLVDNCLTNAMHYEVLMEAVENGKHCLTDKPLAINVQQGRDLLEAAEKKKVHHNIIQNMRYEPGVLGAKHVLEEGNPGRILHTRGLFGYRVGTRVENRPAWFYQRAYAGGGVVLDLMSHFFDLYEMLLGPVESITCTKSTAYPVREDASGNSFTCDIEDVACVLCDFENGALGESFLSWARRKHEDEVPCFEIDAENLSLRFSFHRLEIERDGDVKEFRFDPNADPWTEPKWAELGIEHVDPFELQIENVIRAIAQDKPCRPDWHDGLRALELIDAAYRSSEEGKTIQVQ